MKHTWGNSGPEPSKKRLSGQKGAEEQGKSVTRNGGRLRAIQLFEMSEARKSRSSIWKQARGPTSECLCPTGSLLAMRFLTAVNLEQPDMLERVSRELWMCNWSRMRVRLWEPTWGTLDDLMTLR